MDYFDYRRIFAPGGGASNLPGQGLTSKNSNKRQTSPGEVLNTAERIAGYFKSDPAVPETLQGGVPSETSYATDVGMQQPDWATKNYLPESRAISAPSVATPGADFGAGLAQPGAAELFGAGSLGTGATAAAAGAFGNTAATNALAGLAGDTTMAYFLL